MSSEGSVNTNCEGGDCDETTSLVDRYLDGDINDQERSLIQTHLSGCPDCKHGFDFELTLHQRIRSVEPICMPDEVRASIMLALGFPGMSSPIAGFTASGGVQAAASRELGIPRGEIPRGEIPQSGFFSQDSGSSSADAAQDD